MSRNKNPYRERISFAKLDEVLEVPDLVEIQKASYDWFLQPSLSASKRKSQGLQAVFNEVFPISDVYEKNLTLEFVEYSLGDPKYPEFECRERDATYAAPLKIRVRLINRRTGEIREQDVYMGDLPLMTPRGTFIINGAERVIVNQLHRSPGIVFDDDEGKTHPSGRRLYSAKILPYRGAWIEFEYDLGNVLFVRLDRKRKLPVTTFLRAIAAVDSEFKLSTNEEILEKFYRAKRTNLGDHADDLEAHPVFGNVLASSIVDKNTGEIIASAGAVIDLALLEKLYANDIRQIRVVEISEKDDTTILNTLEKDPCDTSDAAVVRVMEALRPGDQPPIETAKSELFKLFFDGKRYDLGEVGRYQLNKKLEVESKDCDGERVLRPVDILRVVERLIRFNLEQGRTDDTDHLANRRVRSVGELLQNQFRVGLVRMEKVINQRMTTQDEDTMTPQELINIKPVTAIVKEFFGSSQLSQFMDQTNPLAELTHKRRLSALGPGGLQRERALSDVRDVHRTHYGRVCPIETPEGPNIGLIVSLATYARVNEHGFIMSPYRKCSSGKAQREVHYLTADEEDRYLVAQANSELDAKGAFLEQAVMCREREDYILRQPTDVEYIDVSPQQLVSVSTALIPFLEHDDANRALMGSNMQRQAVPLLTTEAPYIGTGMEYKAAYDSGVMIASEEEGTVEEVHADRIVIAPAKRGAPPKTYRLIKFKRSNQSTCLNQRPVVKKGDKVKEGQVIADGPATDMGELALGKNVMVAFMSWEGYNFEDAIIINERLVKEDVFTSIHIEKFEVDARDTKIGKESITRDIPNLSEDALKDLDDDGIICVGARVKSGDILVGKVTPKGGSDLTPEHKLLFSIFGEKARDVRDTSLRVPHGIEGVVTDVRVFSRSNGDELNPGVEMQVKVYIAAKRKLSVGDKMAGRHGNKGVVSKIVPVEDMPYLADGTPVDIILNPLGVPSRMNIGQILEVHFGWAASKLGIHIASPVFNGAKESEIKSFLADAGLPPSGQVQLVNGKSGEDFDSPITVGQMYMLKLHHLVDDKIHARSTGPYSLVTQQPLGGKAQFGGQRLGEMEVWAFEAYGAAYTLQELLTVKSDDVTGRAKIYEAIVKGDNSSAPGIPESFNVLVRELQGLALDLEVLSAEGDVIELREFDEADYLYSSAQALGLKKNAAQGQEG